MARMLEYAEFLSCVGVNLAPRCNGYTMGSHLIIPKEATLMSRQATRFNADQVHKDEAVI